MIELMTLHEMQQQAAVKAPLGLEYQGRHPDAAHAATVGGAGDASAAADWTPFTVRDNVRFWTPVVSITVSLVVIGLYAAGVRL